MSIINDTLSRLEADGKAGVAPAGPRERGSSRLPGGSAADRAGSAALAAPVPSPRQRHMSIPLTLVVLALLLVFAGTGVFAWYGGPGLGGGAPARVAGATLPASHGSAQTALDPAGKSVASALPAGEAAPRNAVSRSSVLPAAGTNEAGSVIAQRPAVDAKPVLGPRPGTHTGTQRVATAAMGRAAAAGHRLQSKEHRHARRVAAARRERIRRIDRAVHLARAELSRGDYQRALRRLRRIKPAPDKRADYWLMLGSAQLGLGELNEAGHALAKAQKLLPESADVAVQVAILDQQKGDNAAAVKVLKQAADNHPDVPEIYLNEGYSQVKLGDLKGAFSSFHTFLGLTEGRARYAEQRGAIQQWLAQLSSRDG